MSSIGLEGCYIPIKNYYIVSQTCLAPLKGASIGEYIHKINTYNTPSVSSYVSCLLNQENQNILPVSILSHKQ